MGDKPANRLTSFTNRQSTGVQIVIASLAIGLVFGIPVLLIGSPGEAAGIAVLGAVVMSAVFWYYQWRARR